MGELDQPPQGLTVVRDFVDGREAARLLAAIDAAPWRADLGRRVQHYGYRYDYRARRVPEALGPMPEWASSLVDRLVPEAGFPRRPDQLIINEYEPGQGIAPHIDQPLAFGPVVASLTLGSGCGMIFSWQDKRHERYLLPGELLVMREEARYAWRHTIPHRQVDMCDGVRIRRGRRVSITFRTVEGVSGAPGQG